MNGQILRELRELAGCLGRVSQLAANGGITTAAEDVVQPFVPCGASSPMTLCGRETKDRRKWRLPLDLPDAGPFATSSDLLGLN